MDARSLYLDLMKRALTDVLYDDVDPEKRQDGRDWPARGYTMIGLRRLDNLQHCIEEVLRNAIPGDFIETGVWRGGATIFMRAMLKVDRVVDRRIWVADSFAGLPKPDADRYPADQGDTFHQYSELAVSVDEVKANFRRFDLLDEQVCFLEGWFRDTLPGAPIDRLAILRLDGDMYESTMVALTSLYPKVSPGGYVIVDDYGAVAGCRKAVDDYRWAHAIDEEMRWVDWTGVYWRRR
jgi:O-methyltransferase